MLVMSISKYDAEEICLREQKALIIVSEKVFWHDKIEEHYDSITLTKACKNYLKR